MLKELIALANFDGFTLDWQETKETVRKQIASDQELYKNFQEDPNKALFYLGFHHKSTPMSDSVRFLHSISSHFIKSLSHHPEVEISRDKISITPENLEVHRLLNGVPYMNGSEYIDEAWILKLFSKLSLAFSSEIAFYQGTVEDFLASKSPDIRLAGRIYFHLVENETLESPFAFLVTYSTGQMKRGKAKHLPLKDALTEFKSNGKKLLELLAIVHSAAGKSKLISRLVNSGGILRPVYLSGNEAYTFLKEIPLYEQVGILCQIPNWWKTKSNNPRLSIVIGDKEPSRLGLNAIVDFDAELCIGDDKVTVEDIGRLLSEPEGLVLIKGKWVEINHKKLKETLRIYEEAQALAENSQMKIVEALRFQLDASKILQTSDENEIEVTNGQWLKNVVEKLVRPDKLEKINCCKGFGTELRPYQQKGLSWLHFMKQLGLGACLADDMGLGKTVQVIALLSCIASQKSEKTLLVVPASLIGNWTSEIVKFAPALRFRVLHPSEGKISIDEEKSILDECDVLITTYGMISKYAWLREATWNTLILDEAQAIKNPATKQTKAVNQLKAAYKIAMTGTPIENRLSDLWSLFNFLNKGLLGSSKEFTEFTKQLKVDQAGYSRLKRAVSPFILRRLKTDKSVISDLPEKIEMKTYSALTRKQTALYSGLVNELSKKLGTVEGIERKGLVLSYIMKFKKICNHPDQYLSQPLFLESESGKYQRLREICETIYENRERVLVFTQFKEITDSLKNFLETVFFHQGLVLHGETPVSKRKEIVDKFQGEEYVPFLVLSIKAGGVGLNLTSANHVIHFDRWWNPAVENQATDRAFRIGQKKNVIVHKFITKGTIEEKIDLMIEDKVKLSKEIIPDIQETWITELGNNELMNLFRLD